jgi:hypothetical protein
MAETHSGRERVTRVPEALGDRAGLTDFLYVYDNRLSALPRPAQLDVRWALALAPPPWFADLEARGCLVCA